MSETAPKLSVLLQQLAQQLVDLDAVQQQELQAIANRSHRHVAELAAAKQQLLDAIQSTDQQLAAHPDKQQLNDDTELRQQRQHIEQLLQDCQQRNDVNERMVASTLNDIEQLRQAILTSVKSDQVTYNQKGKIR
ncbi:flagellar export chaperone FlgN [Idiomarina xiamenensis]|uniref:Flagellar synthesis protein FlgN n=1 Tax=Idiomarina xiamenensis 10-D-4 TaxID=740709 RepID=K2JFG2_9GAMM|nr:flagellar export chaperone FlgN [Idiomarina xiamenensis]EKE82066.1 flagellar synthesis protein FlgN [Idiomarina xiamenensis 10-D-4]